MTRSIAFLTLLLSHVHASPVKAGCDLQGSVFVTESEADFSNRTFESVGLKIRPGMEIPFSDRVSVRGLAGYEMRRFTATYVAIDAIGSEDFLSHYLTLDAVGQFMATQNVRVSAGAGYAVHLKTSAAHDWVGLLPKEQSEVSLFAGVAYQLNQNLSVEIGYQYQLGSRHFQYVDLNIQAVNFGVRYDLPISRD